MTSRPIYKIRQCRALLVLVVWLAFGACLGLFAGHSELAMAMAFPGAGFWPGALAGHWVAILAALLCHAFFAVAILLWFGSGNAIAPPLAWLITILLTIWMQGHAHSAPAPLAISALPFFVWPFIIGLWRFLTPRSPALKTSTPITPLIDLPVEQNEALDGLSRFAFDRALQPLDDFEGFQLLLQ